MGVATGATVFEVDLVFCLTFVVAMRQNVALRMLAPNALCL